MAAERKGSAAASKPGRAPLDHLQADAQLDPDATVGVELAGRTIEVAPLRQWRSRALRALRQGDFETWAEGCLTDDGLATWRAVDPTIAQVEDFFVAWGEQTGQSLGN